MLLSNENKERLQTEFEFIIKKMEESQSTQQMLYYFTGTYTTMNRILNFEFSEDLLFVHSILELFYKAAIERIQLSNNGTTGPNIINIDFNQALINLTIEMKNTINSEKKRLNTLKKFITLSYFCNGNGFYLKEKNMLKPPYIETKND